MKLDLLLVVGYAFVFLVNPGISLADSRATPADLQRLADRLPPGEYLGTSAYSPDEACTVKVHSDLEKYEVLISPPTRVIGQAQAIFSVSLRSRIDCRTDESGSIS